LNTDKVSLTSTAQVPCSNAANIGEHKTWTQTEFCTWQNSVTMQGPQKMQYIVYSDHPEDGQTLGKVWLTSVERRRCSDEVETQNLLKFAEAPKLTNYLSR